MCKRGQQLFLRIEIGKWDVGIQGDAVAFLIDHGPKIPFSFDRDQALSLSDDKIEDRKEASGGAHLCFCLKIAISWRLACAYVLLDNQRSMMLPRLAERECRFLVFGWYSSAIAVE